MNCVCAIFVLCMALFRHGCRIRRCYCLEKLLQERMVVVWAEMEEFLIWYLSFMNK